MSCEEFWNQMPELPDAADSGDHVRECPACAALLEQHRSLADRLGQMARSSESLQPSAALESRLIEAFRNQAGQRSPSVRRYWLPWAVAAAALIVLSFTLIRVHQPQKASLPRPSQTEVASVQVDSGASDSDFVPLPYAESDAVESDDADLVRVEVPRSALVALGVPVPVETGTSRVEAVVALGPDGMLQGIRVLQ